MIALQVVVGGLLLGAVYALFSSGLTLIWGMMNVVNFAHGDFVMLGMYIAYLAVVALHAGPLVFTLLAALTLSILGAVVYYLLIRQVMRGPMLAQILSTFGLALLIRYTVFWFFSATFVTLPGSALGGSIKLGGILIGIPQLVAGILAMGLTIGMHLLLTRTTLGSQILAVSEDRQAAMLMGIRPDRMQALAWGLASASAGVAGALIATFYYLTPTVGESLVLIAFVVVCFGGFGSVPGAMLAGLIIGLIQAASAYYIGPVYKDVVVFALFVAILWVRPQGLLGTV
ncbi:MAG: branched-chain amino acid ABC transporter permease [Candidatus Methylomirabilota bacterium]